MSQSIFSRPSESYTKRPVIAATLWSIAYAVICAFLLKYYSGEAGASPVWIPAGIGLGVLLIHGYRYWPFIFIGGIVGEMGGGHHFWMATLLAAGSTTGFLAAVFLLRKFLRFRGELDSLAEYLSLLFIGAIAALISTSINIQFLVWGNLLPANNFMPVFQKWFTGDYFGMAFVAPIIIIFSKPWGISSDKGKFLKLIVFMVFAFLIGQAIFFGWFKDILDLTGKGNIYLFVLLVMGFYFGRHGAMLLFTLVLVQAILGARFGNGFINSDLLTRPDQNPAWIYLGVACIFGLVISLAEEGRRKKNEALLLLDKNQKQSERHFKEIVANTPVLMATYDLKSQVTDYLNPHFTKVLGYVAEDFLGSKAWWTLAYPDPIYRSEVEVEWHRRVSVSQSSNTPFDPLETLTTCKDGSTRTIVWGCFLVDNRMVIHGMDVTEERRTSNALSVSSAVYRAMGEAVVINDAKGSILMTNQAFKGLTGFDAEEIKGTAFSDLLVKKHGARSYSDIYTSLQAMGRWEGQAWLRTKSGGEVLRFISIYSNFDNDGMPLQRVALISEVTDQRKARELINQQANFDPLTSLPNRRLMVDRLDQLIKQATRNKKSVAIAYLDLDNFKDINDSRGHDFGDQLLKGVAARLRSEVRDTDTVARIGGDEFVILLGDLDRPEIADPVIREVSKKLADPISIEGQLIYVTASIGVSIFPNDGGEGKALLLGADQAMYAAKANGRNTHQYFTTSLQATASYRSGIIAELRSALEKNEFELHYQPIIDLQTGRIAQAEALLRWRKANGEILMPSAFIEIAEDSGLIIEIGERIWHDAITFIQSLNAGPNFKLAINVAASQFNSNQHSAMSWLKMLEDKNISPDSIVLEITERMMLHKSQRVTRKIAMMQEAGCRFSVDDFGTGYSSLASLKSFNFDYIKIDADFIRLLTPNSQDAALVLAMITMAKGLGLESIAEGVETEQQASILRSMECNFAQGYLFNRPMSAGDFKALLKSNLGS